MAARAAGEKLGFEGKEAEEKGGELLNNFFNGFPAIKYAIDWSKDFLREHGYVEDFYGRRRHLPEINLPAYEVSYLHPAEVELQEFNPYMPCDNRQYSSPKLQKWKQAVADKVQASQEWQKKKALEDGRVFSGNDEMSNKAYEKLAAEALKDGILITANTGKRAQAERQCFNARIQGCLSYDSLICTDTGIKKIGDLSNQNVNVFDGKEWTTAIVLPSGKKQKCILTTGTGLQIICSPDHRFLVMNAYGTKSFKKLKDIKKQDRLIFSQEAPVFSNNQLLRDISSIDYKAVYNKHNYSFDDIHNKYIRGQLLGRIASDGSYYIREDGGSGVSFFVAEHEKELLDFISENINIWEHSISHQQKKNQKVYNISISATSLAEECKTLDIKHNIHNYIMSDSEILSGFISGFFDGDGCSAKSNNNINLVFGTQADFTTLTDKMHSALNFFGIRNSVKKFSDRTRIDIRRADSKLFCERIGFMNSEKQDCGLLKETINNNHTWCGETVTTVKSIEITDEYVDMYDVCNTERGYFIVNGLVTHNSAATLTKLAMIDIANDKQMQDMQAKLIIPVHDELLVECPAFYADQVEKRLPELMCGAAIKAHDDIPQACDPDVGDRWYASEMAAHILDDYNLLVAGNPKKNIAPISPSAALAKIIEENSEFPEKSILDVIHGVTSELIFD